MATRDWSRRTVLGVLAAGGVSLLDRSASAQSDGGLLAQLRKAGTVKIALTNGPPYSSLNPDGTVDGVAPTIVRLVMERLGVPKIDAVVSSYGELIPGLQAGRWDIIGADLAVTKPRCEQVVYADPFTIDYAAYAYLPADMPQPPKTLKEMGSRNLTIGVNAGTYNLALIRAAYEKQDNISVFPDSPSIMDALNAKRIQIANVGILLARRALAAKPGSFAFVGPLPDDILSPGSAAFRPRDTDLVDAFRTEFRKMKQSGEWETVLGKFGFDVFPSAKTMTAEQACQQAT